jgi:hypothetical protein
MHKYTEVLIRAEVHAPPRRLQELLPCTAEVGITLQTHCSGNTELGGSQALQSHRIKNWERLTSGTKYQVCVMIDRNDKHARNFDKIKYQLGGAH